MFMRSIDGACMAEILVPMTDEKEHNTNFGYTLRYWASYLLPDHFYLSFSFPPLTFIDYPVA